MFDLTAGYYQFEDLNHTVVEVLDMVRPALGNTPSLLDVGCGRGQLAGALRQLGYRLTGIECHSAALAAARDRLDELLAIDLADEKTTLEALDARKFDVILFADVLEHLGDPSTVLRFYRRFLASGGRIVVSVPNIACWDRRFARLFGHFDYPDAGTMDAPISVSSRSGPLGPCSTKGD